jgi:hypothetical protein
MALAVFIPDRYESRYSLLAAMSKEIAEAMRAAGAEINPTRSIPGSEPTLHLFFNLPAKIDELLAWAKPERPRAVLIQYFVDHPFALNMEFLDRMATLKNFRLAMPCLDDRAMFTLKWPTLKTVTCAHAVPSSALCESVDIPSRSREVLIAGTIATDDELRAFLRPVPELLHKPCEHAAELIAHNPSLSFVQAFELTVPPGLLANDYWLLMQICSRYVVAKANRIRRIAAVNALQGLPVAVHGPEVWKELCTGTIEYRGELPYDKVAETMRASRVMLAWNPTQFTHTFSERVLLSMASGCATLTDGRPLVRSQFAADASGPCVAMYRSDDHASLRDQADRLLKDDAYAGEIAAAGRACVERSHLWKHRVDLLGRIVLDVLQTQMQ